MSPPASIPAETPGLQWLTPAEAAGRLGYRDEAGLHGFLASFGYVAAGRPTLRALSAGVAREEGARWLWLDGFVAVLGRAAGLPDGPVLSPVDTPECIGRDLARAIADLDLRKAAWKGGARWVAFAASRDMEVVRGLRFGPGLGALAREAGIDCARKVIAGPLARMVAACDRTDAVAAAAAAGIEEAMGRLAAIGNDHPLVRYGIVPASPRLAEAA